MPIKKRFSISADLASGIRNTIESATQHDGQLHYDMMPVELIEPDPANPRQLSLNKDQLLNLSTFSLSEIQRRDLEGLKELSASIKRVGIRNAIEVYKDGAIYRIISGERRFLAAILTGLAVVPVRISQRPNEFDLRYTQWVENINRKDLSLWEKYNNLVSINDAYRMASRSELNEKSLQDLIGLSAVQAYRYICLLYADPKIVELVREGKVNNLKVIQELSTMKDKSQQAHLLAWIASSKNEISSLTKLKGMSTKKVSTPTYNLGKIKSSKVAEYILERLIDDEILAKYKTKLPRDYSSNKTISKTFKILFKLLETELVAREKL